MEKKNLDGSGFASTEPSALKPIDEAKAAIEGLTGASCKITETKRDGFPAYQIRLVDMYERPFPSHYKGNILAFFRDIETIAGANNIALEDEINEGGCETCDYGSQYGWEFVAWRTPSDENALSAKRGEASEPSKPPRYIESPDMARRSQEGK